jgi:hypothetical protein
LASVFHGLTCPRQRPFGPGRSGRHPAGSGGGRLEQRPSCHESRRLSAAGIRLLGILSRRWDSAPLTIGLPGPRAWTPTGFPRSAHARCDRGGRPLYPEARGVHATDDGSPVAACRLCQRPGPTTRALIPSSRAHDHEASTGVHLRSPVRSSPRPVAPPDGTGSLGLVPRASHPQQAGPVGRTSRRGPISNTDQELRTRHNRPPICAFTPHARLRVAPHRSW